MNRLSLSLALAFSAISFTDLAVANDPEPPLKLSELLERVADDPDKLDGVLAKLGQDPAAAAVLGPVQRATIKAAVASGDLTSLDAFPNVTVAQLGKMIRAAGKAQQAEANPPAGDGLSGGPTAAPGPAREPLGIPTRKPPLAPGSLEEDLGGGVTYGSKVDPERAKRYPDSQRLAEVLNRLALNDPAAPAYTVVVGAADITSPKALIVALQRDHTVRVDDARYVANFGALRASGREVETPFYVDSEIKLPNSNTTLKVPVAHSQHELIVRGPTVNTDVAFFLGIDGMANFRPMGDERQSWTGGRVANSYTGKKAAEAIRLAGEIERWHEAKKTKHPKIPYGGYYTLGVCNDSNALIEQHMTGTTTLFPLTRDRRYFLGQSEVDQLGRKLPVDGKSRSTPDLRRVIGSLPWTKLEDVPFPALRKDLKAMFASERARRGLVNLPLFTSEPTSR